MNGPHSTVADLVSKSGSKRQTVQQRIERRLEVLQEWLREGIPPNKVVPKSLKAARVWNDAELGILPIVSPNEFTTTHNLYGKQVRDVAGLLTALKNRFGKPKKQLASSVATTMVKFDRKAFDRQLEAAVSQWHSERDQQLHEKKRADAAEMRSIMLLEENKEKDKLIADLRRQLAALKGLKVVE